MKDIRLKVMEALREEAYKGIIRIDSETMREIGVRVGDIVEIEGGRKTLGIVDRAYPTDVGQTVIRMDGIVRRNAKTGIGEIVEVRKADVKEAKQVIVAPAQKGVTIKVDPRMFKRGLLGRAVNKGDIFALGGTKSRRRTLSDSPFFDDVFPQEMFEEFMGVGSFGMASLKFVVAGTAPKDSVIITEATELVVKPRAVEVIEERIPDVSYEDIGGLTEEIKKVRELVELPLKHPELFERLGIEPPKGVLLHGPPGCGKTLLAKAVANESDANFILVNGPEVISKFVGEAEKKIREIFDDAEKKSPSIIFIDEIDAIASKREESYGEVEKRVVAQLLAVLDGLKSRGKVVIIAATNRPNAIDPALRRPGRFDREIVIGVPDKPGRLNILKIHTRNMPLDKGVNLKKWADKTHGFVGADLSALCKEAALNVVRRVLPDINLKENGSLNEKVLEKLIIEDFDFESAMKLVMPSAMREVVVEIPNVIWKDVGGLEDLKRDLKEAVEWPLKYGTRFKKLGIKSPKGVLLYGPPGCGKTLLAKAVANESDANFILVKGPELLNKWVGESLPYDEKLFVKERGILKRIKIGEIVENKKDVEVLCFDKDKRVIFSPIMDYIKHKQTSELMEVVTRTGRRIKVTSDHSLFSFVGGRFGSIPVNHLIPKESFIAIPKRLNLPKEKLKEANLYELFKNETNVFVVNINEYLKKAKAILGHENVANILKVSKEYLWDIIGKNLPVNIVNFDKLILKAGLSLDFINLKLKWKGSIHSHSAIFNLDHNFWRLIGLWIAEGDLNGYTVRIHNKNPEIRENAENICKIYGFPTSISEDSFCITSIFLQNLFKKFIDLKEGSFVKKIPEKVFTLDKISKANFLKGYFSGDGSISSKERGEFQIEAGTVSEELANDLLYLLLDFGIVATLYKKKEKNGSITNRISILGVRNFETFKEIGFIDKARNLKIGKYINSRKWVRSELIPLSGELYDLASDSLNVGASIGKERLKEVLVCVDKDKLKYKEYWDMVEGDIFFDQVKEINLLLPEEYVYDISIPDGQNFVAGFGGVFAHNSEKGVREIFKKARQVSPCIIFFDEIDAIAGVRGRDGGSGVTERIVNTMLTEIDGLQELNDVVVIAATNRPDILDPALLRPGRFDRILLASVPDVGAREEIFKIHTNGMPLAKDVKLKDLVEKTEGYAGSDIEGLIREAGMLALRESLNASEVSMKHFNEALKKIIPSIREKDVEKYKKIEGEYIRTARGAAISKGSYFG